MPAGDQQRVSTRRLSRRSFVGGGIAVALMGARPTTGGAVSRHGAGEPDTWRTWLLSGGDEVRPAPPSPPAAAELEELRRLQAERSAVTLVTIARWDSGPAVLPWTRLALDLIRVHRPSPVRAARALALLQTAIADALVATEDARTAFPRAEPAAVDRVLVPVGPPPAADSSFPSAHAAIAATAAIVLAEVFPKEPAAGLATLADEAATSRLWAGTNYRSDVDAGLAIGRAVGERAVARARGDRSDTAWDGRNRPTDPGSWRPTPPAYIQAPLDPLAGTWLPWVMPSGDAYRPGPPPVVHSSAWSAELAAVQEAVARRTPRQEDAVHFWAGGPGTVTPAGLWVEIAADLIVRHGLDLPHAARVLALTSVAMADAFICCWDAKYTYWTARPITADPSLDVLIPTPPFPSYTSGHSTISTAAATVLGHLFPAEAAGLADRAAEAKNSRLWAGIHFPLDNEMGAVGGGQIGRLLVARALTDGAEDLA